MASSPTRWLSVALSAGCYSIALTLPAYYQSAPAIDGYQTYSGVECLVAPVTVGPIVFVMHLSWWANPLFALGLVALCRHWDEVALGCGVFGGQLALRFLAEAHDPYNDPVRSAFWFWLAAMVVQAVGALLVITGRQRTSRGTRPATR
jgi:hypothetical protein